MQEFQLPTGLESLSCQHMQHGNCSHGMKVKAAIRSALAADRTLPPQKFAAGGQQLYDEAMSTDKSSLLRAGVAPNAQLPPLPRSTISSQHHRKVSPFVIL